MTSRYSIRTTTAVALVLLLLDSADARAQTTPRTEWGDPDLQGVWNYGTMTPLERPARWAGIEVLSEEEALEYERTTMERRAEILNTAGADWWENAPLRNRRTALVVDPPDGRIPDLTDEARARRRGGGGGGQYENPETLTLRDRCIAWEASGPPMTPTVYNNNVQIVQSPGYVVLVTEMIHNARIVPVDGRPHDPARSLYGDSRGHWEGDTLVVETVNFDGRLAFRGSSPDMRLVERFTRTSETTLEYRFTVDDASTWTRPWTVLVDMGPTEGPMFEFACHEGNERSITGIFRGARYEETQGR